MVDMCSIDWFLHGRKKLQSVNYQVNYIALMAFFAARKLMIYIALDQPLTICKFLVEVSTTRLYMCRRIFGNLSVISDN